MTLSDMLSKYDNFIFDLYGTLIDIKTDEWDLCTWEKFCLFLDEKQIKHPDIETFRNDFFNLDKRYREKSITYEYPEIEILDVYRELFSKYGNGEINNLSAVSYKFREVSREYMRLMPDILSFFEILRKEGKKIYILSNAQASYTLPEIQHFELDKLTDDFIMSSDYGCMKPDIHFYKAIMERNCLKKERTVMFGDSYENDYLGGVNFGIGGVHVSGKDFWTRLIRGEEV